MRYRRSHGIRRDLEIQTRPPDYKLQRIVMGLGVFTAVVWGVWMLVFSSETSRLLNWLLNRQVALNVPVDHQNAAYKSAVDRFQDLDFAIAQAMTNLQIGPKQIRETQAWQPGPDGGWLPAERTMRVASFYSSAQCNLEFARSIADAGGMVSNVVENSRTRELMFEVSYGTTVTHRLAVVPDRDIERKVGHLAIVIDDIEISRSGLSQRFLGFEYPLSFSINPWRTPGKKLAEEIDAQNQEVIIHLPMEPESYPRISPGRQAVLVNQSAQENRRIVQEAIAALPMAEGVKNFMGSRATAHTGVMEAVLGELKKNDKYFIDSRTSSRSVADKIARQIEMTGKASWGFLDTSDNQERIAAALDQASFAALEYGPVILIAHARPNTLAVLEQKLPRLAMRGIQFVHASTLVTGGIEATK